MTAEQKYVWAVYEHGALLGIYDTEDRAIAGVNGPYDTIEKYPLNP